MKPKLKTRVFKEIKEKVPIVQFDDYKAWLNSILKYIQSHDSKYSFYSLAEDVGLSRSNVLWLVATDRRMLTPEKARMVADRIKLTGSDRKFLNALVKFNNATDEKVRAEALKKMSELRVGMSYPDSKKHLRYFTDWVLLMIKELAVLPWFKEDPAFISKEFIVNVSQLNTKKALKTLNELDILKRDENGKVMGVDEPIKASNDLARSVAVSAHQQAIQLSSEALGKVPKNERSFNSLLILLSDDKAKEARQIINKACQDIFELQGEQVEPSTRLYQFNLNAFPLNKKKDD